MKFKSWLHAEVDFVTLNTLKVNIKWSESSERHLFCLHEVEETKLCRTPEFYNMPIPASLAIVSRHIRVKPLAFIFISPFFLNLFMIQYSVSYSWHHSFHSDGLLDFTLIPPIRKSISFSSPPSMLKDFSLIE